MTLYELTLHDTAVAIGNGEFMDIDDKISCVIQVKGTFVGSLIPECTLDDTNWFQVQALDVFTGTAPLIISAPGIYLINIFSRSRFRVRISSHTSGSITVLARSNTIGNVPRVSSAHYIDPSMHFAEYLLDGAENNLVVDGSTPVTYEVGPPAGYNLHVSRIMVYMEATAVFASTKFMSITALSNGLELYAGSQLLATWKDNIDIAIQMFDLSNASKAFTIEGKSLVGRWTFTKDTNGPALIVADGETFSAIVQDNLTQGGGILRVHVKGDLEQGV